MDCRVIIDKVVGWTAASYNRQESWMCAFKVPCTYRTHIAEMTSAIGNW